MSRRLLLVAGFGGVSLCPVRVQAHSVLPGAGELTNGLLHPLFSPAHVMVLLGLGLWLGQRRPLALRAALFGFLPAAAAALAATPFLRTGPAPAPALAAVAGGAGLLLALQARLPAPVEGALFAVAAVLLGLDSGADGPQQVVSPLALMGTWLSLACLLVNVAFYSSLLPEQLWARIGLRIAGSWLCAIALLLVAFALRRT